MTTKSKLNVVDAWQRAYAAVRARPEPQDGTLSNSELIEVMKSQQQAGKLLGFKTIGYTNFRGKPIEGKKLVEFALIRGTPLSMPDVKRAITDAAEANDREFFVWLGNVLKKPQPAKRTPQSVDQFQLFMVKEWVHWDPSRKLLHDPKRSLCYYGEKVIADICRLVLDRESLKENTVTQARNRLGLKLPAKRWQSSSKFYQAPRDAKMIFAD